MELEKLQRDIKNSYNTNLDSVSLRIEDIIKHIELEWNLNISDFKSDEIKALSCSILDNETKVLHSEMEVLLAQKEGLERKLQKKHDDLQNYKYNVFNSIESFINKENTALLGSLRRVKLESIELFDLLKEMVESAMLTVLEEDDDGEIVETITEIIKSLTYETIKEGSLGTTRVKKILSSILSSSIETAEAVPTKAKDILTGSLMGMRSGLIQAIQSFKKKLIYMPSEAKHMLIQDYDTIIEDLSNSDILFSDVIKRGATEGSKDTKKILLDINKNMKFDLEELVFISKETVELMKTKFSTLAKIAVLKADSALKSKTAIEAKRMGKDVWHIAKVALDSAIKYGKDAMDKKSS